MFNLPTESLKPLTDWPGYFATADGHIVSAKRKKPRQISEHVTKLCRYRQVGILDQEGKQRLVLLHSLICSAFHGPRPSPVHETRHLDGDHLNNVPSNLAWGTKLENADDRRRHGRYESAVMVSGEQHGRHRITADEAMLIHVRANAGEKQDALAAEFGISQSTVSLIKLGKKWGHLHTKSTAVSVAA